MPLEDDHMLESPAAPDGCVSHMGVAGSLHADGAADKATVFLLTRTHSVIQDFALYPSTHVPNGMWMGYSVAEQSSLGNKEQSHTLRVAPWKTRRSLSPSLAASKCLVHVREIQLSSSPRDQGPLPAAELRPSC